MAYATSSKTQNIENQPKSTVQDAPAQKSLYPSSLAVWLTPKQYYCEECGYLGIIVMELEKDDDKTKET